MHLYYVCAVVGSGIGDDPYRPALVDRLDLMDDATAEGVGGWATDIPSDPGTGAPLRPWCIVAVEADQAAHDFLQADAAILAVLDLPPVKAKIRQFLSQQGETETPDEPQGILTLLHPLDGRGGVPQIANLRASRGA